mmetsp:Transcript_40612/g.93373  ORF Transcript_40612/g.93373 Transcript_40612/m.93373 type:complete len:247 (-) Transcript_40612:2162-2902(-)
MSAAAVGRLAQGGGGRLACLARKMASVSKWPRVIWRFSDASFRRRLSSLARALARALRLTAAGSGTLKSWPGSSTRSCSASASAASYPPRPRPAASTSSAASRSPKVSRPSSGALDSALRSRSVAPCTSASPRTSSMATENIMLGFSSVLAPASPSTGGAWPCCASTIRRCSIMPPLRTSSLSVMVVLPTRTLVVSSSGRGVALLLESSTRLAVPCAPLGRCSAKISLRAIVSTNSVPSSLVKVTS